MVVVEPSTVAGAIGHVVQTIKSSTDSPNLVGQLDVFESAVFECSRNQQACLFRGLSAQLLMVLIAGLDVRLLTPVSLRLGSIVARLTW